MPTFMLLDLTFGDAQSVGDGCNLVERIVTGRLASHCPLGDKTFACR